LLTDEQLEHPVSGATRHSALRKAGWFAATPLDCAEHFGRTDVVELLRASR
jgi:hypothetical protein